MAAGWRAEPRVGTRSGARLRIGHTGDCTLSTSAAGASTDPPRPAQPSAGRLGVSSPAQGASGHLCRSGSADQEQEPRLWEGPPLQGDFVRRVVPRPAPTRGRGTSGLHTNATRSDEIPLQRRPSRRGVPRTAAAPARSRWTPTHSTWPDPAPLNREKNQKKGPATSRRSFEMARPERFELPTAWFVARYSIQLSYGRVRSGIMRETFSARQAFFYFFCSLPWRCRERFRKTLRRARSPHRHLFSAHLRPARRTSNWRSERDSNPR